MSKKNNTKNKANIWYPCMRKSLQQPYQPINVTSAKGCYLHLDNGKKIIDAISSWWCKSLGHNHPRLKQALLKQIEKFEHVILANSSNDLIETLSAKLVRLSHGLAKVFYASDGSSAVESAMKMSLHSRLITGDHQRQHFISLSNSYHGETVGALSVSDVGIYRQAYEAMLFTTKYIENIPYVSNKADPLWADCSDYWPQIEKQLDNYSEIATAIIVEPLMQGAGGMQLYSCDLLKRLASWAKQHNVHLIADEIMTGMGRTGKMLASDYADIQPDFICLGKGLTSGWLPLSAVITHDGIYDLFYGDNNNKHEFLHSHTYSGNALAAAVALETIHCLEEENICQHVTELETIMLNNMNEIAEKTQVLTNVRGLGAIVAADVVGTADPVKFTQQICAKALELGALLRPLGQSIYWLPPLNSDFEVIEKLKRITIAAI